VEENISKKEKHFSLWLKNFRKTEKKHSCFHQKSRIFTEKTGVLKKPELILNCTILRLQSIWKRKYPAFVSGKLRISVKAYSDSNFRW
jgi:hypothetical protein